MLRSWAEEFAGEGIATAETARLIDLHLADATTAFFTSASADEAQALGRFFAGKTSSISDPASQAAAIAAMIRRSESDDIHVGSCVTPAAIAMPVALALAAHDPASAQRFDHAVAAGYAVAVRLGRSIGGAAAMGAGVWPTLFAAPITAAAVASIMLDLDPPRMAAAMGLAAAGTNGRAGRLSGALSGRWLTFGEAVRRGCRAAFAAADGFSGDADLVSPEWLAAHSDIRHIRPETLTACAHEDVAAVGLKPFIAARQTINAIVAFQAILAEGVAVDAIEHIEIGAPTINAAMVSRPPVLDDRLSVVASMSLNIAAAALWPDLLHDAERQGQVISGLLDFSRKIEIRRDETLDAHLPDIWAARVVVSAHGRRYERLCEAVPGDPGCGDPHDVILNKIARQVANQHQPPCRTMLDDSAGRAERRSSLWRAMLAATDR